MTLQLAYLGLTLIMNIILLLFGMKVIRSTSDTFQLKRKRITILIVCLILWQVYMLLIGYFKVLYSFDFPPRFVIFSILPLFAFTGIFLYKNRKKDWIKAIPSSWLLWYQSFRILIESIFVASVTAGILHYHVTILGYNFDMVYAYSIPVIALLIFKTNILPKKVLLIWNYLGLAVIGSIIFLFISTIYFPAMWGTIETVAPLEFTLYPYALVPGFLMPSAVFIHVWSIVKYHQEK